MDNDNIQKKTLRKIAAYIKPYRALLMLSIIFATVSVVLTLYIPILTGHAIDYVIAPGAVDFAYILKILTKMAVIIIITGVVNWGMSICNNRMTYEIVQDIREDAFEKIEHLPLKYLDAHAYGETVSRIVTDVDTFAEGLLMGFAQLFTGIVTILGTLIFMFAVNPIITLVVVVITPVSLLVASFFSKKKYHMFRLQPETRGEQNT